MPGTYPPAAPTLSGDVLTINRLLQEPRYIRRRLRSLAELRFVSDRLLTRQLRSQGGAVLYEQSEPIVNARPARAVAPGSAYPGATPGTGTAGLAAVQKWGQTVRVTFEQVRRSRYPGDEIDRALRKLVNTVISQVDAVTIATIASNVTETHQAAAAWDSTNATIWRDIALAAAEITGLNQGYNPDTILMSDIKAALVMSDPIIAQLRRREVTDNPIYTAELDQIGGFQIVTTIAANLPSDDVFLLDSRELGGMADESELDPGYSVTEQMVQVKSILEERLDAWDLQARRPTVPVVMEPGAAIRIIETAGS